MRRLLVILVTMFVKFMDNVAAPSTLLLARGVLAIPLFNIFLHNIHSYKLHLKNLESLHFIFTHLCLVICLVIICLYIISFIIGLANRITALIFLFIQIYADYNLVGLQKLFILSEHSDITILFASIAIIIFGPGIISIDYLIKRKWLAENDS